LGQLPVELRWDEETVPLWASLAPLDTVFSELEPEEAAPTLSVTGKPDDTVFFAGEINSSLYQSAKKAGLSARQTKAVENIFRYSIDFQRDLRKGDYFEVLFEKQDDGTTGDILYTKLNNRGSEIALYLGIDDLTGLSGYFDATGKSNKRSLMRTPISGARISSHFGMRHHPILGYNKMHRGTDFAAPRGTPIFAAGDGVIEYLGRNGAYGKYIRIRHNNIYKTAYAHMSRYAPGLLNGSRVRQGDVIGYVGSTGRSTGPHLHFEILENDNRINPMQVADFGPVQGLSSTALTNFLVRVSRIEVALSLLRDNVRVAEAE
jgi:murein DD-endopeptidase MepM/ murein hydrolase activator NlpD